MGRGRPPWRPRRVQRRVHGGDDGRPGPVGEWGDDRQRLVGVGEGRLSTIRASGNWGALRHFLSIRVEEDGGGGGGGNGNGDENGGSEGKSGDDGASSPTANGTPSIVVEDAARNLTITESLELLFDRIGADHPRHDSDFRRVTLGGRRLAGGGSGGWIDRILRAVGVGQPSASTGGFIGPLPRPAGPSESLGIRSPRRCPERQT